MQMLPKPPAEQFSRPTVVSKPPENVAKIVFAWNKTCRMNGDPNVATARMIQRGNSKIVQLEMNHKAGTHLTVPLGATDDATVTAALEYLKENAQADVSGPMTLLRDHRGNGAKPMPVAEAPKTMVAVDGVLEP
jgi:hypothetical protein